MCAKIVISDFRDFKTFESFHLVLNILVRKNFARSRNATKKKRRQELLPGEETFATGD